MTPTETEIARGFVACKGFRWLPGMLSVCGIRISDAADGKNFLYPHGIRAGDWRARPHVGPPLHDSIPDVTDPAFPGLALFLVREAWKEPGIGIRQRTSGQWQVLRPGRERSICCAETEAGALLLALQEAP